MVILRWFLAQLPVSSCTPHCCNLWSGMACWNKMCTEIVIEAWQSLFCDYNYIYNCSLTNLWNNSPNFDTLSPNVCKEDFAKFTDMLSPHPVRLPDQYQMVCQVLLVFCFTTAVFRGQIRVNHVAVVWSNL